MALDIVEVKEGSEHVDRFLEHIDQDTFEYFFFHLDWKHERDKARFYMALKGEAVAGLMIIYRDAVAQVRGGKEAAENFFDLIDLEKAEIMVSLEHKDLLLEKWDAPIKDVVLGMTLHRGDEKDVMTKEPVRLGPDDAEEVARVLRDANKVYWGEVSGERIAESMADLTYLGIREDEKLVAMGSARALDIGGHIFAVATDEDCRGRGYATSIVCALVNWLLKRCSRASIFVKEGNPSAFKAYTKVGFKPRGKYYLMKFAERKA